MDVSVDLRASDRSRLLFSTACHHGPVEFLAVDLDFMDQTDPFDCDCRKLWLSLMSLSCSIWIFSKPDEQLILLLLYCL